MCCEYNVLHILLCSMYINMSSVRGTRMCVLNSVRLYVSAVYDICGFLACGMYMYVLGRYVMYSKDGKCGVISNSKLPKVSVYGRGEKLWHLCI